MAKHSTIKILVGYHRPAQLLKSEIFVPIHLGRALANEASKDGEMSKEDYQWMCNNMIGDDTGDNISKDNLYLNELSALYWAWKNYDKLGNPDYFGFMHYRRHLCFDLNNTERPDQYGLIYSPEIDDAYLEKYHINDADVEKIVQNNDIVVAEKTDLKILGTQTVRNHYKTADKKLHVEDLDAVVELLLKKHPEYEAAAKEYLNSQYAYFTNIFITKKEIFFKYCDWLFDIIFDAQKVVDLSEYNVQEMRALAYISEWLFGIFLTHEKQYKKLELKRTFVQNTDLTDSLKPVDDEISVAMSVDENYAAYLAVCLTSLIEHTSESNKYTVYILNEKLSDMYKSELLLLQKKNVKIKFINVSRYINNLGRDIFYLCDHFSVSNYYRFFIPQIFKNFAKVVYCDCDALFLDDVAKCYDIPLENKLLGVVHDTEVQKRCYEDKNDVYFKEVLKLKEPRNYFNSGFLIFNIKKLIDVDFTHKCMETLKMIKQPRFVDQCILNVVCEGRCKFIDGTWNVENHLMIWNKNLSEVLPYKVFVEYKKNLSNAKFLHYTGAIKPWQDPSSYNAVIWWKYARMTPFYEEIMYENLSQQNYSILQPSHLSPQFIKDLMQRNKLFFKYWKYKVLSKITFGKKYKRCKQKKQEMKQRLKAVKLFLKGK